METNLPTPTTARVELWIYQRLWEITWLPDHWIMVRLWMININCGRLIMVIDTPHHDPPIHQPVPSVTPPETEAVLFISCTCSSAQQLHRRRSIYDPRFFSADSRSCRAVVRIKQYIYIYIECLSWNVVNEENDEWLFVKSTFWNKNICRYHRFKQLQEGIKPSIIGM